MLIDISIIKLLSFVYRVSTDILIERANFFGNKNCESDKSLLRSFLQQDNLDLKDIIGMMVDILMAAIDTVSIRLIISSIHNYLSKYTCVKSVSNFL